eukprot:gene11103-12275_t
MGRSPYCACHVDFVTAICFHPKDDRYFLSGSLDGKIRLWNIPEKRVALWNEIDGSGTSLITAANFCREGKLAVVGTYDGRCIFYDTERLKYHTQLTVRSTRGKNARGRKISGIEPMPGEDKVLITSNDSRVRLYDLKDHSLYCKYKGSSNSSSQIKASFSHDGRHIVCGSEDHFIYIWKTYHDIPNVRKDRSEYYESFSAHDAVVTSAVFAPIPSLFSPLTESTDAKEHASGNNSNSDTLHHCELTGLALLTIGIWSKVSFLKYMKLSTSIDYNLAPYIMIGCGCFIILVGFLGCWASLKEHPWALILYMIILVLLFLAELSAGIAGYILRQKLQEGLAKGMKDAMKKYPSDKEVQKAVDDVQAKAFHCCGADSYKDWMTVSNWPKNTVPQSCCKDQSKCQSTSIKGHEKDIYQTGCVPAMKTFFKKNFAIIGGVALGIAFFQNLWDKMRMFVVEILLLLWRSAAVASKSFPQPKRTATAHFFRRSKASNAGLAGCGKGDENSCRFLPSSFLQKIAELVIKHAIFFHLAQNFCAMDPDQMQIHVMRSDAADKVKDISIEYLDIKPVYYKQQRRTKGRSQMRVTNGVINVDIKSHTFLKTELMVEISVKRTDEGLAVVLKEPKDHQNFVKTKVPLAIQEIALSNTMQKVRVDLDSVFSVTEVEDDIMNPQCKNKVLKDVYRLNASQPDIANCFHLTTKIFKKLLGSDDRFHDTCLAEKRSRPFLLKSQLRTSESDITCSGRMTPPEFSKSMQSSWAQSTLMFQQHETLDFSSDNLYCIPEEILLHQNEILQHLKLNGNEISELPHHFGYWFPNLRQLDLNHNKIMSLPDDFGLRLRSLQHLNLNCNEISELPHDFGYWFPNLHQLDLSDNKIMSLPDHFGVKLRSLQHLNLNGNEISELPHDLGYLFPNLHQLDLSDNKIMSLSDNFGVQLRSLQHLNLNGNEISELPHDLGYLFPNLHQLDLSDNKIMSLSDNFGVQLRSLQHLNLNGNEISELPHDLGYLFPNLHQLDLSDNKIMSLSDNFGVQLRSLQHLNLNGNEISELPHDLGYLFPNLHQLDLSDNKIMSLSDNFGVQLRSLQHLNLNGNEISELPHDLGYLFPNLCQLDLSDNKIMSLPDGFGVQLRSLRHLNLKSLQHLNLKSLQHLNLNDNRISELPQDFGNWFPNLRRLDLSDNKIMSLPDDFGVLLWQLQHLNLNGNKISELPHDFGNWFPMLQFFSLDNNHITFLPNSITNLKDAIRYSIEENPLVIPPIQICTSGLPAIKDFFHANDLTLESTRGNMKELKLKNQSNIGKMTCFQERGLALHFKHLDVSLQFPSAKCVQMVLKKERYEVNLNLDFGESMLSDMIMVGSEVSCSLNSSILTIPINLFEQPSMTEIVTKHFDSSKNEWINLPVTLMSDLGDNIGNSKSLGDGPFDYRYAQSEIQQTGIYVVCLVLKSVQFEISPNESQTIVCPFREDIGVELLFHRGTFGCVLKECTAKINMLTNDAIEALRNFGIETSHVLHINAPSGILEKPVEIQMPFQQSISDEGELYILQENCENAYEDITSKSRYKIYETNIRCEVYHFSWVAILRSRLRKTSIRDVFGIFQRHVYPAYKVHFSLYGKKAGQRLSCKIACSLNPNDESLSNELKSFEFERKDYCPSARGVYRRLDLTIVVQGRMKSAHTTFNLQFDTQDFKYKCSNTFTLEDSNQNVSNRNYIYLYSCGRERKEYGRLEYDSLLALGTEIVQQTIDEPESTETSVTESTESNLTPALSNNTQSIVQYIRQEIHQHQHCHDNRFEIEVRDGASANIGEINVHSEGGTQVLPIAYPVLQGNQHLGIEGVGSLAIEQCPDTTQE